MTTTPERETLEIDVLFVGAGPANLAGALHLSRRIAAHNQDAASRGVQRLEPTIAVLEKGKEIGSHALSGAVLDPRALQELLPDTWREAPFEGTVEREKFLYLTSSRALSLPIPPPLDNRGKYVISLGRLVRWLATQVEAQGIDVFCEFPAAEALVEEGRVVGVRTGDKGRGHDGLPKANFEPGVDIRSKVVVLGEGPRGTLAKQLEGRLGLTEGRNPQVYALGLKEVWDLPPGRVEAGEVIHTLGWPLTTGVFGGGFVYGMRENQLIVGLVVGLDYRDARLDPHTEFQRFKTHPSIRRRLEGGRLSLYGAKAIPEGGYWAMPRLFGDGFLLCGDSGGFLNGQRLKGIHLAMKSGMLAADTIFEALLAERYDAATLSAYEAKYRASWAHDELHRVRNFHQGFDHGRWPGVVQAGLGFLTGGRGWGVLDRLSSRAGHERMQPIAASGATSAVAPPADGQLTFDKLADVYHSATAHEENQPVHLLVSDPDLCVTRCTHEFGNPCEKFCPAAVYEMVDDPTAKAGRRLQINASNCVHCKTCDVMDPYQVITWVPPEGGGGPNYSRM